MNAENPTQATPVEAIPAQRQPVPQWVGVMIALLLLCAMASGAALWAWSHFNKPDEKMLAEVRSSAPMSMVQAAPRPPTNGIIKLTGAQGQQSFQVRAGEVVVQVTKGASDADWVFRSLYNKSDLIPTDQMTALVARSRLANDPAYAKYLKVTDEQIKQLKELPASMTEMVMSPADQTRLKAAFTAYVAAPKTETEQAVVKAAQEIGVSSLAGTRKAITERADKIKSILSAEQLAAFKV